MNSNEKAVIVTTKHRGVFFGYAKKTTDFLNCEHIELKKARCCIRWYTAGGFLEFAEKGPNSKSIIGSESQTLFLRNITSISFVSEKALEKWEKQSISIK